MRSCVSRQLVCGQSPRKEVHYCLLNVNLTSNSGWELSRGSPARPNPAGKKFPNWENSRDHQYSETISGSALTPRQSPGGRGWGSAPRVYRLLISSAGPQATVQGTLLLPCFQLLCSKPLRKNRIIWGSWLGKGHEILPWEKTTTFQFFVSQQISIYFTSLFFHIFLVRKMKAFLLCS